MSQAYIAEKIGISRPSYIEVEKGKKELTISQAQKIAQIFEIKIENLISGKKNFELDIRIMDEKEIKETIGMRIDVPQKNIKKFKEVLLYILERVGGKPNVGMTVLYKLLYFIDFDYYEKFEEQLIGATYIKNHFGPTPVEFKKVIESMESKGELETVKSNYFQHGQTKYLPKRQANLSVLSANEIKHIDEVLARLSNKNATELSNYSHEDIPWIVTKENQPIKYEGVFYRTEKTSVRNYDDQDYL